MHAPALPRSALTFFQGDDPDLRLPAGTLKAIVPDRLYALGPWIVAVKVSSPLHLVARRRPEPMMPPQLLEQLVGFFVGHGSQVLRLEIRFPECWFRKGGLDSTVLFWIQRWLSFGKVMRLFVGMPPRQRPGILLPVKVAADSAAEFWSEALILMDALFQDFRTIANRILPELHALAESWERQWNAILCHAETCGGTTLEDQPAIHAVDRAWSEFVNGYLLERGFLIQPATLARLL